MGISNIIQTIRDFLFSNETRTKITVNILWRVGDKFIRLGVGLFVSVWIARYLGTEQFGIWNYALAYITLFLALAGLGLDDIVAKDIVNDPIRTSEILGSAFVLKILGGGAVCLLAGLSILFIAPDEPVKHLLVLILAIGTVFQAFNAIEFYFVAIVQSKYPIIAKNIPFLLVSGLMIVLLLTNRLTVVHLAVLTALETLIAGCMLVFFYQKSHVSVRKWSISVPYCLESLKQSWPLILSGIVVEIFLRIDQIMIGNMLGDSEVGIYSAAVRISEIWYFLPQAVAIAVYPNLIETRKKGKKFFYERYLTLFRLMNIITISFGLLITLCSEFVITLLFGEAFAGAAPVLAIHIWGGFFSFLAIVGDKSYIIEGLQRLFFVRMIFGAILNIVLNLILIPQYGVIGAATGLLLTQFFVSYFVELFHPKTRFLFLLKTKSFLFIKK